MNTRQTPTVIPGVATAATRNLETPCAISQASVADYPALIKKDCADPASPNYGIYFSTAKNFVSEAAKT